MGRRAILLGLVSVAITLGVSSPTEVLSSPNPAPELKTLFADEPDFAGQEEAWAQFRRTFPLHIQTIAISENEDKNGNRTLIVSEPPPHVTLAGLEKVDAECLAKHEVKEWTIGHDGWVKDVIFQLPRMTAAQLTQLTKQLSEYLFHTDYKAHSISLPVGRQAVTTKYPLDVRVYTSDLESWYTKEQFFEVGTNPPKPEDLSKIETLGVYQSAKPGMVAWVAPKEHLETRQVDIRKFALDSDLVLGAVARERTVVIFARERVAPLTVLPPLRTEMIVALAAAKTASLSQSYERMLYGAGRAQIGWDWAPIYLSPELLDTEYGSVLNNTDQMLKGWSEAGGVQYYNFPCPNPRKYPFDESVSRVLKAKGMLFNWNTSGFGVRSDIGDNTSLYATTRTGALPLTYKPQTGPAAKDKQQKEADERILKAEEDAYTYFATQNNPLLAKAVQYATAYQIFQSFAVTAVRTDKLPEWSQSEALKDVALVVLKALRTATDQDLKRAGDALYNDYVGRLKIASDAGADKKDFPLPAEAKENIPRRLTQLRDGYKAFLASEGEDGEKQIATLLGRARDSRPVDPAAVSSATVVMYSRLQQAKSIAWLLDVDKIQAQFSKTRGESANPWLHTPTVVYSRSLGVDALKHGGHNLDPAVTKIRRTADVAEGKVRVTESFGPRGQRYVVVECNPANAQSVERNARAMAGKSSTELKRYLDDLVKVPVVDDTASRYSRLETRERPQGERGTPDGQLMFKGPPLPPKGPPRPPTGTLPPEGPMPSPGGGGFGPGAMEVLLISQTDGMAKIRRQVHDGNTVVADEVGESWNQRDLIYALRAEYEAGGRTIDKKVRRLSFDSSFKPAQVERIMKGLALHDARAGSDRLLVIHHGSKPEAFRLPIEKPTVAGDVKVEAIGSGLDRKVAGTVQAASGDTLFNIEFDVRLSKPGKVVTGALAEATVTTAIKEPKTLGQVAPAVYNALLKDFKAQRDGSSGVFKLGPDIGDLHLVKIEHEGKTVGLIALWK